MTPLTAPTTGLPLNGGLPQATKTSDLARAEAQAQEFESVFLSTMLNQMFSGLSSEGPFHGGHAEEQFRGLLVEEIGTSIAEAGGIGLADAVRKELIAIQEESGQ